MPLYQHMGFMPDASSPARIAQSHDLLKNIGNRIRDCGERGDQTRRKQAEKKFNAPRNFEEGANEHTKKLASST